jgi:protease I
MGKLSGRRVALLVGPGFEDSEALYPFYRLQEEGADVEVVGVGAVGSAVLGKHGVPLTIDQEVATARADRYDALVLPGNRGPDQIRAYEHVQRFTREFFDRQKPVAAICHGPQILISADVLKGVHCTAVNSVAKDVQNAGAIFEDRETVIDAETRLVTARVPRDIPAWMRATVDVFAAAPAAVR